MHSTGYYTRTAKQITQKLMIFYSGNAPSLLVPYGQSQEQKAAVLKIQAVRALQSLYGKR